MDRFPLTGRPFYAPADLEAAAFHALLIFDEPERCRILARAESALCSVESLYPLPDETRRMVMYRLAAAVLIDHFRAVEMTGENAPVSGFRTGVLSAVLNQVNDELRNGVLPVDRNAA
jgi:hypothetical protein